MNSTKEENALSDQALNVQNDNGEDDEYQGLRDTINEAIDATRFPDVDDARHVARDVCSSLNEMIDILKSAKRCVREQAKATANPKYVEELDVQVNTQSFEAFQNATAERLSALLA